MKQNCVGRSCWCGCEESEPLWTARDRNHGAYDYVKCCGCGLIALFPQPDIDTLNRAYGPSYYGKSGSKFIKPVSEAIRFFQRGRAVEVIREIRARKSSSENTEEAHAPSAMRLLDVGCGNGGFLYWCAKLGIDVLGTEFSDFSAHRARTFSGAEVLIGEVPHLGLRKSSFAAITFWHVFEHLREPDAYLSACHELLTPEGILFLSLPNAESVQARSGPNWLHLDPPRHLFSFGLKSLDRLLDEYGFTRVKTRHLSLEQNPMGFLQSWLNQLGFQRDEFFEMLKGRGRTGILSRAAILSCVGVLAAPALAASLGEAVLGQGGTVTLLAEKKT